ncbi:MAG: hypothetical protein V1819_02970 [bacterium]
MPKDTIEILRVITVDEIGVVEKAAHEAHCSRELSIDRRGGKTTISIPRDRADKVYKNLVKLGVIEIEVEENIASQ